MSAYSSSIRAARLISLDVPDADLVHISIVAHDPLARMGLAALLADQPHYIIVDTTDDDGADVYPDAMLWDTGPGLLPLMEPDLCTGLGVGIPAHRVRDFPCRSVPALGCQLTYQTVSNPTTSATVSAPPKVTTALPVR